MAMIVINNCDCQFNHYHASEGLEYGAQQNDRQWMLYIFIFGWTIALKQVKKKTWRR